jgi:TrkA domain protein
MEIRVREERLPGVGVRYELELADGSTVFVIAEQSGRRHLGVLGADDEPAWQVALDQERSVTLAALLLGARFTVKSGGPPEPAPSDEVVVEAVELSPTSPAIGLTAAEIRLPDDDAVVLAVYSDLTPELLEDERSHRCRAGDRAVLAARSSVVDVLRRHLQGSPDRQVAE